MNILLSSPDNGVTRDFMAHVWVSLLKSLTLPERGVFLIDGNAQPMTESEVAEFVRKNDIRLVGISAMSYTPENITIEQAEAEVREAWTRSYSAKATMEALRRISHRPLSEHAVVFFARLAFRDIYFPQMRRRHWLSLLWRNRQMLMSLCYEAFHNARPRRRGPASPSEETA
jgi:RNase P protein component